MTSARIDAAAGVAVPFTFDGRRYEGRAGDTIASALLAAGVRIVGRSFKYHRPRGIWGAWTEEPNALVDVTLDGRTTPNLRATTEPLVAGMAVRSVNAHPTAEGDRGAFLDRFAAFIPSGFYYKTFLWPDWRLFEPRIRAMAGLGRLDPENRPAADWPQINATCDVLVVGAGPAGLAAAKAAAGAGRSVILLDDRPQPGGSLLHRGGTVDGMPGAVWASAVVADLAAAGHRVLTDTTAYGIYDHDLVCAWQRRPAAPTPCGGSGRRPSSSPRAPSSGRWSLPTTTGRASCRPTRHSSTCAATAYWSAAASSSPPTIRVRWLSPGLSPGRAPR